MQRIKAKAKTGEFVIRKNEAIIALSAFMLALSFLRPTYFSFFVFLFLVPIFYLSFKVKLSFKQGFFWGIVFYFVHFFDFIFLFINDANGKLRVLVPFVLMVYSAIYAGLWFFLSEKSSSYFFKSKPLGNIVAWTFWTYCYFNWISYGSLWIFGDFIGYPFSYPILPLASYPSMLYFLKFFSQNILLICIIVFSLCIALFLNSFKKIYFFISLLFLLPFLCGKFVNFKTEIIAEYVNKIGHISPVESQKYNHFLDAAQEIYYKMTQLIEKNPHVNVIVMPESSYLFPLNKEKSIVDLWHLNILGDDIELLIGAPRKEGDKLFNSLYRISQGQIKQWYDKVKLMAFVEFFPNVWKIIPQLKNLFLKKSVCFSSGNQNRIIFTLCKNINLEPYICADIFLKKKNLKGGISNRNNSAIFLAVNDSAFPSKYMRNLMFMYALLQAIEMQRDVLYVGYYFASWITKNGSIVNLPTS